MSEVFQSARLQAPGVFALDAVVATAGAALLLAWDALGWDRDVSRWFGDATGFAWRDAWWTSGLLHQGGRALAWCMVALLLVHCWRPLPLISLRQNRKQRFVLLAVVLLCIAFVPTLKQFSATSCPWDLQEFGGAALYVPHWDAILNGTRDGGPGRCFPSGHAVAAFGFFPVYFALRRDASQRAKRWLCAILMLGCLLGAAQSVRGAHYVSHTLWSAWCCWVWAAGFDHCFFSHPARDTN